MENRPNPDELLKRVKAQELLSSRGKLKIFFGAFPGAGKTYAMLEAAHQRKKEGIDVVIGIVETHDRAETQALLKGLEILPRKELSYKGVIVKEFDLDGALHRRAHLVLVDELAHSNAQGLRHRKRWQDIEELLEAGIDVYTTLNVQHWESLNDVVSKLTGVVVRETVPDTFLSRASDLELVDLAPEDLLKRLKDGKVYHSNLAAGAAKNFFKLGNLIALRELALRHTAERVEAQMQDFKDLDSNKVYSLKERLLVGINANSMSMHLVRATSRMARRLHVPWIALYVETPAFLKLSLKKRDHVIEALRLAERLGAEAITLPAQDVAEEILNLARLRNVTGIVLGKSKRAIWNDYFFDSLVNKIARSCGNIDLHVINSFDRDWYAPSSFIKTEIDFKKYNYSGLIFAIVTSSVCTLICWPIFSFIDRVNLVMIYLLAVVWTAYCYGRWSSFITTVLSILMFDFFFIPPRFRFAISDTQYLLTFAIMLAVGFLISEITTRLRWQTFVLRKRQERLQALYKLSRNLSETPDTQTMLQSSIVALEEYYKFPFLILTYNLSGDLVISAGEAQKFGWTQNEFYVAQWVFDKNQIAGAGSDTLSGASGLYLPLKGIHSTMGVLGVCPKDKQFFLDPEQQQLIETFAAEIGGALESTRLSQAAGRAEMQMELQVLNSASSSRSLHIADFLNENKIVFLPSNLSKEEVFRILLNRLDVPNFGNALKAILDREKAGATMIGKKIFLPHARLKNLQKLQVCLGLSLQPEQIWILFLGQTENPQIHLSFLSAVAKFFQHQDYLERLFKFDSPQKILHFIRQSEIKL